MTIDNTAAPFFTKELLFPSETITLIMGHRYCKQQQQQFMFIAILVQNDVDRAAAAEGAPAGGDARTNVRVQAPQKRSSGNPQAVEKP